MIACAKLYSPAVYLVIAATAFFLGLPRTNATIAVFLLLLAVTVFISETEAKMQRRILARRINDSRAQPRA